MCQKSFVVFLTLLYNCLLIHKGYSQTHSGLGGNYWLAGYEANYKYAQGNSQSPTPLATRLQHKWYLERLISPKTNVGIAFTHSVAQIEFEQFAYNYILYSKDIEIFANNKMMYVDEINGVNELKTIGYEFFAKRYFNANAIRNYGWYFTYKYGRMYLSDRILKGASVRAHDLDKSYWESDWYSYNDDEVHRSKLSYIGIDLGRTYPLHHSKLLFSASFSYNISFNKTKTDNGFDSHLNKIAGRHVARRQMLLFNAGISYVL